ncbi:hypothetical protein AAK894_13260 [Lachnospiraceae bacterium 46-61]
MHHVHKLKDLECKKY